MEGAADVIGQVAAGRIIANPALFGPVEVQPYAFLGERPPVIPHGRPDEEVGASYGPTRRANTGYGEATRAIAGGLSGARPPRGRNPDRGAARAPTAVPSSPSRHEVASSRRPRRLFPRGPLPYDEAPILTLPCVPAAGGTRRYFDRVGARGELARGETQAARGPTVLEVPRLLPIEVHVYVVLAQGTLAVRHHGLNRRSEAADVSNGAHGGYGDPSARTTPARPRPGAGSRPRV